MIEEKRLLDDKIKKLKGFIGTENFLSLSEKEQEYLSEQYTVMKDYSSILEERISLF